MSVEVADAPDRRRFEATVDGAPAGHAEYLLGADVIVFPHTEVDPAFEGRGVGSALARAALDEARRRGLSVLATCPFIAGWMRRHPEYLDLAYQNRAPADD
ncbi:MULTISPECIES: GNAT family N-acetyltransferase [Actinokineospora]|uniref:N-acetyltransferase n=1 Tax=Actinokineospora fastidiosa TaxID=1816 RepID=A0A918G713_9PSEU|nr:MULTISPECIES: GNAT family N-acetyltransferase [Actinokineospora]UVS82549.1 Acetyltransferase (GNAT) family protein [Actinokineospora sp. UTMC 2448]GGS20286.1 N-acetyltransferase [Actinokineospora fastidiosa]